MEAALVAASSTPMQNGEFKQLLDSYERRLIESALRDAGSNQRRAAAALGILPTTLCEKMKRLGLRSRNRDGDPATAEDRPATRQM